MRQVSRLAHRARLAPRGRPKPRWLRPVQMALASIAVAAALGFGTHTLHRLGMLADAAAATREQLLAFSARLALIVENIFEIIKLMNEQGTTIFLVEQNARKALELADRAYILEQGRVVGTGTGKDLLHNDEVRQAYLGFAPAAGK